MRHFLDGSFIVICLFALGRYDSFFFRSLHFILFHSLTRPIPIHSIGLYIHSVTFLFISTHTNTNERRKRLHVRIVFHTEIVFIS